MGSLLEDDRVSRQQSRHQPIDRDEVGVIPGGNEENDAQGLSGNVPGKAILRRMSGLGGQAGGGNGQQVLGPGGKAIDLIVVLLERAATVCGRVGMCFIELYDTPNDEITQVSPETSQREGARHPYRPRRRASS